MNVHPSITINQMPVVSLPILQFNQLILSNKIRELLIIIKKKDWYATKERMMNDLTIGCPWAVLSRERGSYKKVKIEKGQYQNIQKERHQALN